MKILVVGLDCAAPELLLGEPLPNIRRLMEAGAYGRLESIVPPITTEAMTSISRPGAYNPCPENTKTLKQRPAKAEQKPLKMYTSIFVRSTGRPMRRADCSFLPSLPPIAYKVRPKRV